MKSLKLLITLIAVMSTFTGCLFWKSTTLVPKRFAFIKSGSNPGEAVVKIDEYGLEELSLGIGVSSGRIGVADNDLKRFQIIKSNGDLELMIGSPKMAKTKNIKAQNFNFGTMGFFSFDEDGNVFIQNKVGRPGPGRQQDRDTPRDNIDFLPSYILAFNNRGELQYTLGQKGAPDVPFYQIEKISVDGKGHLFVISKSIDSWSIYRFRGKRRDYFVNLSAQDFKAIDSEEEKAYDGKIDNLRIFMNGESALVSVSYYHSLRLKYIRIFEYSLLKNKAERMIMEIPDPKNVLFDIIDDKYIYLWNIAREDVKFEVVNLQGNLINNVYLKLKYKRNYYTKIILDESGRIYSYHIMRNGVEIVRWD